MVGWQIMSRFFLDFSSIQWFHCTVAQHSGLFSLWILRGVLCGLPLLWNTLGWLVKSSVTVLQWSSHQLLCFEVAVTPTLSLHDMNVAHASLLLLLPHWILNSPGHDTLPYILFIFLCLYCLSPVCFYSAPQI